MVMNIIINENQYKVLLKYVNNNKKNERIIEQEETIDARKESEENALSFARDIEVLKEQKMSGLEYGTYWCKDCTLTTTGTLVGDINFESRTTDDKQQHGKFCVNEDVYYGKWKCDSGYSLMSVISKEYDIVSLSNENITKTINTNQRKK